MRRSLILLCVCCTFTAFSQVKEVLDHKLPTLYIVDSIPLNEAFKDFFSAYEIADKRMANKQFQIRDTIFITLKDHAKLHEILNIKRRSLGEIVSQRINNFEKSSSVIFFQNDSLLTDTTGLRISALRIFRTESINSSKTSYYKNFPGTTFFYIYTTPTPFHIRGNITSNETL